MTFPPRPFDLTDQFGDAPVITPAAEPTVVTAKAAASRFAQLTYSSFDDGTGISGGWQVKETSGKLSDAESEALRYWVNTTFDLVSPLPQFPTPEDVANFPRRLMYTRLDNGRAGYWHTAPAGADGSGRPGNVFAHTVLDRNVAATDIALRPIELWRSTDWLTPYGAGDVSDAHLVSTTIPRVSDAVSQASVIDFLCDPDTWRLGILSVLLDAVAAALDGGASVIIATETPDSAALWIGAVSYLTSPGVARTISWSTLDRASGVAATVGRGVHVIAIPTADLHLVVPTDELVVLSENEMPSMGDLGGAAHRTEAGSAVAVTEWSVIAQGILIEAETALPVLTALDRVAVELGDSGLHPMLPLALAVSVTPDLHEDVGDEAAAVIARYAPPRLSARVALVGPASELIDRTLGITALDCWNQLASVRPDRDGEYSVAAELIMAVYIERSLRDVNWLVQPGGVPFLPVPPRIGWVSGRLSSLVVSVVAELRQQSRVAYELTPNEALHSLRAMDLMIRASCIGPGFARADVPREASPFSFSVERTPSTFEVCEEITERLLVPVLCDAELGPRFAAVFGDLNERSAAALVRPVLASAEVLERGVIGRRLPLPVLEWVLPSDLAPPPSHVLLESSADNPQPLTVLAAELAAWKIADEREARRWSSFNLLVLWRVLHQADNPAVSPPDLGSIFSTRFDVDVLSRLVASFPGAIPPRFFLSSLALAPAGEGVSELATTVEAGHRIGNARPIGQPSLAEDDLGLALASIRLRIGWPAMASQLRQKIQEQALVRLRSEVLRFGVGNLAPELVRTLAVLTMVQILKTGDSAPVHDDAKVLVRAAENADRVGLVSEFSSWVRPDDVKVAWLVESAILGSDEAPEKKSALASERFLCSLTEDIEDRRVSLLDAVVDHLVEGNAYQGPSDSDGVENVYYKRVSDHHGRGADKVLGQYRKFSKKWLDDRGLGAGGLMSRLRRKP
nr:hypothetical protein [Rhodococcus sp. (in: high G+C Gram-positive bacteria)]